MAAVDSFHFLFREVSRSCTYYCEALALVGALYAAGKAAVLVRECCSLVRVHFLPRLVRNQRLKQRFGDWAVICGVSAPLARAYGEELARHGVSIVFITQDPAWVGDSAALVQSYGVEALVVLADLSLDQVARKSIGDALRDRDVGFLVTCVDESSPQSLTETPEQQLLDLLTHNVALVTLMTRLVLPGMLQRGRGAVVHISAGTSWRPRPGRVALTACTGYLDRLSRALHLDYSSNGIFVQSLIPLQISPSGRHPSSSSPPLTPPSRGSWFAPTPEVYVRHAVSTLGVSTRTTGYWPHAVQYGLMTLVPRWIWVLGSRVFFGYS